MKKLLAVKNIVRYLEIQINTIIWQNFMNCWEKFPIRLQEKLILIHIIITQKMRKQKMESLQQGISYLEKAVKRDNEIMWDLAKLYSEAEEYIKMNKLLEKTGRRDFRKDGGILL